MSPIVRFFRPCSRSFVCGRQQAFANIVFLSLTRLYFFHCQYCISFIDNIVFLSMSILYFLSLTILYFFRPSSRSFVCGRQEAFASIDNIVLSRSSQSKLFWMLFKVAFISKAVGCYLKPSIIQITFSPTYNGLWN